MKNAIARGPRSTRHMYAAGVFAIALSCAAGCSAETDPSPPPPEPAPAPQPEPSPVPNVSVDEVHPDSCYRNCMHGMALDWVVFCNCACGGPYC